MTYFIRFDYAGRPRGKQQNPAPYGHAMACPYLFGGGVVGWGFSLSGPSHTLATVQSP